MSGSYVFEKTSWQVGHEVFITPNSLGKGSGRHTIQKVGSRWVTVGFFGRAFDATKRTEDGQETPCHIGGRMLTMAESIRPEYRDLVGTVPGDRLESDRSLAVIEIVTKLNILAKSVEKDARLIKVLSEDDQARKRVEADSKVLEMKQTIVDLEAQLNNAKREAHGYFAAIRKTRKALNGAGTGLSIEELAAAVFAALGESSPEHPLVTYSHEDALADRGKE